MPRELKCRFDETHGTFAHPPAVAEHYRTEHAHEWSPPANPKVMCLLCARVITTSNRHSHMKLEHQGMTVVDNFTGVPDDTPLTARSYNGGVNNKVTDPKPHKNDANQCTLCGAVIKRASMREHFRARHTNVNWLEWREHVVLYTEPSTEVELARLPEKLPHTFGMHGDGHGYVTDDFWLPIVNQLATPGGMVPVEAMAALVAFRDDLARMLHAVSNLKQRR